MSRHEVTNEKGRWVFGWDQMLQGFFLHLHDDSLEIDEKNPVIWLRADQDSRMYEIEDLVRVARREGLEINLHTQNVLYLDKDEGR